MLRHPLVRQILGAIAGSAIAALLYVGYTGASHAVGGDLSQVALNALLGGTEGSQLVGQVTDEPADEPAPLPELGVPLREGAIPAPAMMQATDTVIDTEPVPTNLANETEPAPIAAETIEPEPMPVVTMRPAAPEARVLAAATKAEALPSSGAADWLVIAVSAGAALGWQHRRLMALAARVAA